MEFNQEENDRKMNEEETSEVKIKQWFQDNLRIIISVLIVVLIAGGIYSYSKRSQAPTILDDSSSIINETTNDTTEPTTQSDSEEISSEATQSTMNSEKATEGKTSSMTTSQETGSSFVETAVRGDSMTTLARKSLSNYLEKNPDSTLTAEHKIYIEDYLRKHVTPQKVTVGTSVEFSKDLIKTAIESSKTLNTKQLQNLHKYALRVPSLT